MSDIISWPIGPLEGDQYSVNGKFWEWNGCAWISTCCPGTCDIYDTGIILGLTYSPKYDIPVDLPKWITTKICFKYDAQTGTWNSESLNNQGDYYQMVESTSNPGVWELNFMSLGNIKQNLGGISGTTPIGNWEWKTKGQTAESICGCPPMICGCLQEDINSDCEYYSFFPVSHTGVSGATEAYVDIANKLYIYYNTINSQWELYPIGGYPGGPTPAFTISLPMATVPIGDNTEWIPNTAYAENGTLFSTTVGHCNPCNDYTDGIILAWTTGANTPAQVTTYVPLTWNGIDDQFQNFDGTIYIEYNGANGEWNLWINGTLEDSHQAAQWDLLGYWSRTVTILCGTTSVTNTEGCLVAVSGGENAATLYLQENTFGEFNYGYPFSQPTWQIICNAGVWYIQEWDPINSIWVNQATVAASCATPPYNLSWTMVGNYDSFTFTEGPCPITCNSYQFRSISGDSTLVSFKLCGCNTIFYIYAPAGGVSATYCVQEDSIDLGAFGAKQLVSAPCTPNPTECYTLDVRNNSNVLATLSYINCAGSTLYETIGVGDSINICGRPCSINVTNGSVYMMIIGLGCV